MEKGTISFGVSLTQKEANLLSDLADFFETSNRSEVIRLAIEIAHNLIFSANVNPFDVKGGHNNENSTTT